MHNRKVPIAQPTAFMGRFFASVYTQKAIAAAIAKPINVPKGLEFMLPLPQRRLFSTSITASATASPHPEALQ